MKKCKYLIIGAGVSGLSFAGKKQSEDYIILEKEDKPGGLCKTTRRNGYVWDYSGHFFHFNNDEIRNMFMNQMKQEDLVYNQKKTKIYYKGKYIDFPFQKNIHQLEKEDLIDCVYGLFFRPKERHVCSFKDMLYTNFGEGITERFLRPYNEKLYACDINKLDADAMGRFFPYASVEEIIRNFKYKDNASYNSAFMYHKKGAYAFIESLLQSIKSEALLLGERVVKIDYKNKIVVTNSDEYAYSYLISTASFADLMDLIEGKHDSVLSYNKVTVYNLGFDSAPADKSIHWIYYPEKDYVFYRVGFYSNILHDEKMSLYVEIGQNKDEMNSIQLEEVIRDLKKAGIITNQNLVDFECIQMSPAYVHLSSGAKRYVEEKKEYYKAQDIYTLGRYGNWEYSSIEDAVHSALELAKNI